MGDEAEMEVMGAMSMADVTPTAAESKARAIFMVGSIFGIKAADGTKAADRVRATMEEGSGDDGIQISLSSEMKWRHSLE